MPTMTANSQQKTVAKDSFFKTVCFIFAFDGKGNVALVLDYSTTLRSNVAKPLSLKLMKSKNTDIQFSAILDKTVKRHLRYDFDTTGMKMGTAFIKDNIQYIPYRINLNGSSSTAFKSKVTFVKRTFLGSNTLKVNGVDYQITPAVKQAATLC